MSDGTPTKFRIWHASRDAYHCAFRIMRILSVAARSRMEFERLRVIDMYLLFPSLLHRTSMTREAKGRFRALAIPAPDDVFESLPSIASVFQELRLYQTMAASYLTAKGILRGDLPRTGVAEFLVASVPDDLQISIRSRNAHQEALLTFLVDDIAGMPLTGGDNIYRRAGLPARHLLS